MEITEEIFAIIPTGSVFRVLTTDIHQGFHDGPIEDNGTLTFVCKKGDGGHDWAIYYGYAHYEPTWIAAYGNKVREKAQIQDICPCSKEVLARYRY